MITTRYIAMYQTIQAIAERERSAQIDAALQVDALLSRCAVRQPEPELFPSQSFAWLNSPEAIAMAVVVAMAVFVTAHVGLI